ncbi:MAG: hypothetical protein LC122_13865 [Chitinophagales bacterium]|nr:hypothetical protein [Chitinophagales bacterium]
MNLFYQIILALLPTILYSLNGYLNYKIAQVAALPLAALTVSIVYFVSEIFQILFWGSYQLKNNGQIWSWQIFGLAILMSLTSAIAYPMHTFAYKKIDSIIVLAMEALMPALTLIFILCDTKKFPNNLQYVGFIITIIGSYLVVKNK